MAQTSVSKKKVLQIIKEEVEKTQKETAMSRDLAAALYPVFERIEKLELSNKKIREILMGIIRNLKG
jgi:hypothetical protein